MTGVDIALDDLHHIVSEYSFYNTGYAGLMSNAGNVISHQNEELMGTNYFESDAMKNHERNDAVKEAVGSGGKALIEGYSNTLQTDVYRLFTPIQIEGVDTPWSAFLAAPVNEVTKEARDLTMIILSVSVAVIVILAAIILSVTRSIVNPIRHAVATGGEMAQGNFAIEIQTKELNRNDEIGELARIFKTMSENMRELIGKVQNSSRMVL